MILYGSIIFVCVCLLTGVNAVFAAPRFGVSFWFILGAVLINVVAVIAVDGLFAFLIRRLPEKWFGHERRFFSGFGKGKKVLRKTKNP